jgi:hypothetical protein
MSAVGAGDGVQPRSIEKTLQGQRGGQADAGGVRGSKWSPIRWREPSLSRVRQGNTCRVKEPIPAEGLAHKCIECKKPMHGICGGAGAVQGEESHGAGVDSVLRASKPSASEHDGNARAEQGGSSRNSIIYVYDNITH